MKHSLPSSSEMLEELASKVDAEIDRLSTSSFRSAVHEMTDFHRFLISAYLSEDVSGKAFSFAEMGFWRALHKEWLGEYRDLFERAVSQISKEEDTAKDFIKILMNAVFRLLPSGNEKYSPKVTSSLFDLHLMLIHRLEDWAVHHHVAGRKNDGVGDIVSAETKNLQKKYEDVIRSFISSSESLLQTIPSLSKWEDTKGDYQAGKPLDHKMWEQYRVGWGLLEQHLRNTAYFPVVSTWNDDKSSTPLYAEALCGWLKPINYKISDRDYIVRHEFLTPDILQRDWDDAQSVLKPYLKHPEWEERINPSGVFKAVLENAQQDVILLVSGILLGWHLSGKNEADFSAEVAAKIVQQAFRGNIHGLFICLLRILSSGDRFRDDGYAGTLDGFIDLFDRMTERDVIPGRVYTPSTRNEREDLFLPWAVLLLSMMPEIDPDKVTQELLGVFEHEEFFPDADNSIGRLVRDFEMMKKLVSDADQTAISGAFSALRGRGLPDLEFPTALENYNNIIDGVLSGISQKREARISVRPIDPQRLDEIESAACEKGFNPKTGKFPLYLFDEILTTKEQLTSFTNRHDRHERGSLTNPLMDQPVSNEKSWWSSTISDYVAGVVLGDVLRQSEKTQAFTPDGITYWQAIANFMGNDKSSHILIVSGRGDPEWLREWEWGTRRNDSNPLPNGVTLWRSEDYKDKQGYRFHLNSLPVFQAGIEDGHSFLLSKSAFKKLEFTIFDNNKTIKAEVEAIPDDPWHVVLRLVWARRVNLGENKILEISYKEEI